MRFEWDDQKALENVKKHGVTFGEATEVFYDPNAVETEDTQHLAGRAAFFDYWIFHTAAIVRRLRRTTRRCSKDYFSKTIDAKRKGSV